MKNYLLIKNVLFALLKTSVIMILIIISPIILFTGYIIFSCFNTTTKVIDFKKSKEIVIFSSNTCGFLNPTNKLSIKIFDENNNINEEYSSKYKASCYSFYYKKTDDTLFIIQYPSCEFTKSEKYKKSNLIIHIEYLFIFDEIVQQYINVNKYKEFPPQDN
ncbi:MAG: hypothetical protein RO257_15365 [Candidatus Kapabacteria bacterium]|nr:hypothetical protein [Candidatus Kapabacteria bacterium]